MCLTFHNVKVSTSWDSQNSQQVTIKTVLLSKKRQRYARIVAPYLSAEKQHAKDDKNNGGAWPLALITSQVAWINSRRRTVGPRRAATPWTKTTACVSLHVNHPFIRPGEGCQVPLVLELHFVLANVNERFCCLLFFKSSPSGGLQSREVRANEGCDRNVVGKAAGGRRLPATLFSLCLLIVPLCHWKTLACSGKICGVLECLFPPQYPWKWQHKGLRWVKTRHFSQSGSDTISRTKRDRLITLQLRTRSSSLKCQRMTVWQEGEVKLKSRGERRERDAVGALMGAGHQGCILVPAGLGCCTLYCKHKHTYFHTHTLYMLQLTFYLKWGLHPLKTPIMLGWYFCSSLKVQF